MNRRILENLSEESLGATERRLRKELDSLKRLTEMLNL